MLIGPSIGLISLLSALAAEPPEPWNWTVNGEKREAIVTLPEGPRTRPAPVVFVFHGHASTMEAFARKWPVHKFWPEAVGVYMQGLPTASKVDPKGKKAGWQSEVGQERNRDLKFVDAVLKTLHEKHTIDDDRIYAAGHSNGGGFTYVLWMARPDVFAAYAPCSANLHAHENQKLKPRPVLHMAGENDNTAPLAKQRETMDKVREVNGCQNATTEWAPLCKLYPPKTKTGAPFISLIHSGGHAPPPHAFELMVKFFKENPRQGPTSAVPR